MLRPLSILLKKICIEFKTTFIILNFMRSNIGVDLYKLSTLKFLGRFINMVVMFLPLKAFLILSGVSQIGYLHYVEDILGKKLYIISIVLITIGLYIINVFLQVYSGRLLNKQSTKFDKSFYDFEKFQLNKKFFISSHILLINFLSDCLLVFICALIFFFLSIPYACIFLFLLLVYIIVIKYMVFIDNKFSFLQKINLDESQILAISNGVFYLAIFIALFFVFIYIGLHVYSAILILLLSRLSNGSIKSIMIYLNKISKNIVTYKLNE